MSFLYELPKTLIYKMPITTGHNYYFLFKRHNMSHRLHEKKKYIYIYICKIILILKGITFQ